MTRPPEITEGMEMRPLTKGPIRVRELAMFAVATSEFVDIHYDRGFAQASGLPDTIIQGWYKTALIAQMLKNWAADNNALKRLNVQHRAMDVSGSTLTAGGTVTGITRNGGTAQVECDVWIQNQHGKKTTMGTATLQIRE